MTMNSITVRGLRQNTLTSSQAADLMLVAHFQVDSSPKHLMFRAGGHVLFMQRSMHRAASTQVHTLHSFGTMQSVRTDNWPQYNDLFLTSV